MPPLPALEPIDPDIRPYQMTDYQSNQIIDRHLVQRLVENQFPQWKNLPIEPVIPGGWDNRTFRLAKQMLVRLPSAAAYAANVEKEQTWLPRLAPFLPLVIPEPLAMGKPSGNYPWAWSVYRWIEGDTASSVYITNLSDFAADLAQFLTALQRIDTTGGPPPGKHNFYRGGALSTYDNETRQALIVLKGKINVDAATHVWEAALATTWSHSPVWIHGDISPGNLLVYQGRLKAVIDFGGLAVGDPACDLAIAWTMFKDESREVFRKLLHLDTDTWARGRGWTLWKALIVAAGFTNPDNIEARQCWNIINEVLADN